MDIVSKVNHSMMSMYRANNQMPPPNRRVLGYSPLYNGAVHETELGLAIVEWNPDRNVWSLPSGKPALFPPTHRAFLPVVSLEYAAEGVADMSGGNIRASHS